MNTITIEKSVLLPIIQENKQKHDNIYNLATSGYWVKAEEILKDKLTKIQNKEKVDNNLGLTFPISYVDEYDRVIRMLQLTVDNTIELNHQEFDNYVRNQWNWRNSFLGLNTSYISGCTITGGQYVVGNSKLNF